MLESKLALLLIVVIGQLPIVQNAEYSKVHVLVGGFTTIAFTSSVSSYAGAPIWYVIVDDCIMLGLTVIVEVSHASNRVTSKSSYAMFVSPS